MKRCTASRLAWTACALTLVLIAGIVLLAALNPAGLDIPSFSILGVTGVVVGGVVASHPLKP